MKPILIPLAVTAGLLFARPALATPDETGYAIAEADVNQWNTAVAQGNLDGIASLFTQQSAMLIQPNGQAVQSREAIRAFWKSLLESPQGASRFRLVKARRENGDTVVTRMELIASKSLGNAPQGSISYHYQGLVNHVLKHQPTAAGKSRCSAGMTVPA
ncbi:YybH family protein [Methylogaea oryzae]|uniref:YybH family protein n=1 Tax=Methylogaea oryzae TaxID=1295382 RepID=UPI0006D0ABF7|nr:nuclear transport factor 2 family protein [Methylogaea oryzae]